MKVFCFRHNMSFLAPRRNPIACEEHDLGEIDFGGKGDAPPEVGWEYCCHCQHFWPGDIEPADPHKCPVCRIDIGVRYLCDRCYTMALESTAPNYVRNFTLTPEGCPQPSCPACLQFPEENLALHECESLGLSFWTALSRCPLCEAAIGAVPKFPSTVTDYLSGVKAGRKKPARLDYKSNLFVLDGDGDFMVVPHDGDPEKQVALPRSTHFDTKQEFYEKYQDCYYCSNPSPGEMRVIYPAAVEKAPGGWVMKSPGLLTVLGESAEDLQEVSSEGATISPTTQEGGGRAVGNIIPASAAGVVATAAAAAVENMREEREMTRMCVHCGEGGSPAHPFCWNCGKSYLGKEDAAAVAHDEDIKPGKATERENERIEHGLLSLPLRSSFTSHSIDEEGAITSSGNKGRLPVVAAGVIGLALLTFLGVTYVSTPTSENGKEAGFRAASPQRAINESPSAKDQQTENARPVNEEVSKRAEEHVGAPVGAEKYSSVAEIASEKTKRPEDYRLPYERAKRSIKGTHSHTEAFEALFLAAEKAIDNGRSNEMLAELKKDRSGDLSKVSRGHAAWRVLEEALRSKDKNLLRSVARR